MTGARKLALLTRRELAFVVTVCFSLTFQATNFAMMAAFFPLYAVEVGISITQTNAVFIAYSVAKMLTSPVAGALASRFGRRRVLIGGIALVGCSTVFIGLTPDLTQREVMPMVAAMTGARVLQGIGLSCSQLATFAMLSDSFPAHRSLVSGSAISAIGLGWAIGPPIGGVLYVIGGFRLPFVAMGAIPLGLLCPLLMLTTGADGMQSSGARSIAAHNSKGTDTLGQVWRDKTPIQLVARKPDVWIVAFTAFGYMSKWGWWDIQVVFILHFYVAAFTIPSRKPANDCSLELGHLTVDWIGVQFTTWCVQEFQWGIETSSLFMGMLAAIFALLVPLGGWLGDHPRGNRMLVMATSLATLAAIYIFMGPWQLQWTLENRRRILVPYIVLEGLLCPLLEPIFLPQMIDSAMEDYGDKNAVDEHLTNFVTSIFQTAFNLGQVVGPFAGAHFIGIYGFRGALLRWSVVFAVVSAGLTVRLLSRRVAPRSSTGAGDLPADMASEHEPLVTAES